MKADLVFHSGNVLTVDSAFSRAEAAAVRDGRVLAVGQDRDILDLVGSSTRTVDLAGGTLMPGLNDSHLHLQWYGLSRTGIDLSAATTLEQVRALVAHRARSLPPGAWIRGRGWHERRLHGVGPDGPATAHLDDVSGGHPVFLEHFSAHGAWLNTEALRRAGITADTRDPDGGEILRDRLSGTPTGVVKEAALELAQSGIPSPTAQERQEATVQALAELNRRGVTSVTDPIVTPEMLRDYVALRREDRLTGRVSALLHWTWPSVQTPLRVVEDAMRYVGSTTGLGDDLLRVGGCKLIADGVAALGTAWMSRPYHDGRCGSLVTEGTDDEERVASLHALVRVLHEHRFQVQVHATGDRACDTAVAAIDKAMTADPWPEARHVLIHANLPSPESMHLMARHGMVANTNALIKWQAAAGLKGILDEESWHRMMPVRSLLDAGVVVADSSDAPITDPDWRRALQMLVTRTIDDGETVAGPTERVSREDALRAWTSSPAYQDHQEHAKGTIETGKLADLVVLHENMMTVPDDQIHAVTPVMTVLGGRIVHEA
jgi:predicted amidohydrolase YtcJ